MDTEKKVSIMAVDDEEIILDSIKDYFDTLSIEIYSNPLQALERMKNNFFDILIVDYKMPELNGLDLLIQAKKNKAYYYGILLTAYADKSLLEKFINKALIQKIIEKPLHLKVLEKTILQGIGQCREYTEEKEKGNHYRHLYEDLQETLRRQNKKEILFDRDLAGIFGDLKKIADSDANILRAPWSGRVALRDSPLETQPSPVRIGSILLGR